MHHSRSWQIQNKYRWYVRGIYGRFNSKILFEIESDGWFDSRFDLNAEKRFAGPYWKHHASCKHHGSVFYTTGIIDDWSCGNRDFRPLLVPWLWPWPDYLHIWTWPVFPRYIPDVRTWTSCVKAFESYHITDLQARLKLYTMLLCGWSLVIII